MSVIFAVLKVGRHWPSATCLVALKKAMVIKT